MAGTVRLLFQPAEEILGGAAAMIEDGALDGVDMALGFHNHPDIPVGHFGAVRGATYAACDRMRIVVRGRLRGTRPIRSPLSIRSWQRRI